MFAELAAEFEAHGQCAQAVVFSHDGKTLLTAGNDHAVKLWGIPGGWCQPTLLGHEQTVDSLSMSADGEHVASTAEDHTVCLWSIRTGHCEHVLTHQRHACYAPDGRTLLTVADKGRICFWGSTSGRLLKVVPPLGRCLTSVCWSPEGAYVLAGVDGQILQIDHQSGRVVCVIPGHMGQVCSIATSPDGLVLASTGDDGYLCLWQTPDWRHVARLRLPARDVLHLAWSPRGRHLAMSCHRGLLLVRRVPLCLEGRLALSTDRAHGLAWSPDGKWLASAASDGHVRVWRVRGH